MTGSQMSPYPCGPSVGFCDLVDLVRFLPRMEKGRISQRSCDEVELHTKLWARVGLLRNVDENQEQPRGQGLTGSDERSIAICATALSATDGDYVRIPFGTRGNTFP